MHPAMHDATHLASRTQRCLLRAMGQRIVSEAERLFEKFGSSERQRALRRLIALRPVLQPAQAMLVALDDETLRWQLELARVAAPTGSEGKRAALVLAGLHRLGHTTARIDDAGNVIAHIAPSTTLCSVQAGGAQTPAPPLVCFAHLDTVFGASVVLEPRHEGTRISCPGIGDNGRGLAALMTIAEVLGPRQSQSPLNALQRPIELVATVGEEGLGNLRGSHAYIANRARAGQPNPHAVIVLDGPGESRIVHHALGSRRLRITFTGQGGHSWADFGNPNAVHAAGRATAWLAELPRTMNRQIALTVSGIGGGESVNSIPMSAWLDIDLRATDQLLLQLGEVEIRRIAKAAADVEVPVRNAAALSVTVRLLGERPCGSLGHNHPLVALANAASDSLGIEPVSAIASTDANVPLSLGIPAITIGAGGIGGGAHTINEWYENTNAPRGLGRALAIILGMAA